VAEFTNVPITLHMDAANAIIPDSQVDANFWSRHPDQKLAQISDLVYTTPRARDEAALAAMYPPLLTQEAPFTAPPDPVGALRRVRLHGREHRPENTDENRRAPTAAELTKLFATFPWYGPTAKAETFYRRSITGFAGPLTTHELLQWGAALSGIALEIVEGMAWQESQWKQDAAGDWVKPSEWKRRNPDGTYTFVSPPPGTKYRHYNPTTKHEIRGVSPSDPVPSGYQLEAAQSDGILQMKKLYHGWDVWPLASESTAFNIAYVLTYVRAVKDGTITWLKDRVPTSGHPAYNVQGGNDIWLCIGHYFSGGWADAGALEYIQNVKNKIAARPWDALLAA